jgi:hypothetical protein
MKAKKNLKLLLSEFFHYHEYREAIIGIRAAVKTRKMYKDHWSEMKEMIQEQKFEPKEALWIIHHKANLVLHENTEEEAYNWFELLIQNVEILEEDRIIEY